MNESLPSSDHDHLLEERPDRQSGAEEERSSDRRDDRLCRPDEPEEPEENFDPFLGRILDGKYEMLSLEGGGGTGLVYKARHTFTKRIVAVKVLFPHMSMVQDVVRRFQTEAEAASLLDHKNIVSVTDFGLGPEGQPYLVMGYLDGISLSDKIEKSGKGLPYREAVELIRQTLSGLAHAHEKGIVHRDLKPSNLMIVRSDEGEDLVKIVDFGLAKMYRPEGESATKLTQTGEVFGSPNYMSPEQCKAERVDRRTDIYSTGCMLYEVLTGAPPFVSDSPLTVILKHIGEAPPVLKLPDAGESVRVRLETCLLKSLQKDPKSRYATAAEFSDDLQRAVSTTHSTREHVMTYLKRARFKWSGFGLTLFGSKKAILSLLLAVFATGASLPVIYFYLLGPEEPLSNYKQVVFKVTPQPVSQEKPPQEIKLTDSRLTQFDNGGLASAEPLIKALETRIAYFFKTGQHGNAEADLVRLLKIRRQADGEQSLPAALTLIQLGDCYMKESKQAEARKSYQKGVEIIAARLGAQSQYLASPLSHMAEIDLKEREFEPASMHFNEAIKIWDAQGHTQTADYALAVSGLAEAQARLNKLDGARELYEQSCKLWQKFDGVEKENTITCLTRLGDVYASMHHDEQAENCYAAAISFLEKSSARPGPEMVALLKKYARAQMGNMKVIQSLSTALKARRLSRSLKK